MYGRNVFNRDNFILSAGGSPSRRRRSGLICSTPENSFAKQLNARSFALPFSLDISKYFEPGKTFHPGGIANHVRAAVKNLKNNTAKEMTCSFIAP